MCLTLTLLPKNTKVVAFSVSDYTVILLNTLASGTYQLCTIAFSLGYQAEIDDAS